MELLRVDEAAEILKIQADTVYRFIRRGVLPCVKLGRTVRIDREDLTRLIKGLPSQRAIELMTGGESEAEETDGER
jgi:excisionase family DNA binding protein